VLLKVVTDRQRGGVVILAIFLKNKKFITQHTPLSALIWRDTSGSYEPRWQIACSLQQGATPVPLGVYLNCVFSLLGWSLCHSIKSWGKLLRIRRYPFRKTVHEFRYFNALFPRYRPAPVGYTWHIFYPEVTQVDPKQVTNLWDLRFYRWWSFEFFWVVTMCSDMLGYQRFGRPCCLHLDGNINFLRNITF
jgi:hypothetical protein